MKMLGRIFFAIFCVNTIFSVEVLTQKKEYSQEGLNKALLKYSKKGDLIKSLKCLQQGAVVNYQDKNLATALHWAAKKGSINVCLLLLLFGGNIELKDRDEYTPEYVALSFSNLEVANLLAFSRDYSFLNLYKYIEKGFSFLDGGIAQKDLVILLAKIVRESLRKRYRTIDLEYFTILMNRFKEIGWRNYVINWVWFLENQIRRRRKDPEINYKKATTIFLDLFSLFLKKIDILDPRQLDKFLSDSLRYRKEIPKTEKEFIRIVWPLSNNKSEKKEIKILEFRREDTRSEITDISIKSDSDNSSLDESYYSDEVTEISDWMFSADE